LVIGLVVVLGFLPGFKKKEKQVEQPAPAKPAEKQAPGLAYARLFAGEVKGLYLAGTTGEVLVYGDEWVEYLDGAGKQLWKKTGYQHVCGGGVSRDGQTVLFQTSPAPKVQQSMLELTVHVADRAGNEIVNQPNPQRYFTSILSPKGNYIVFGDPLAQTVYVYDRQLNLLWTRNIYLWYVGFDPEEQLIYDSASGIVLSNRGRRVWQLPSGAKFLSVSSGAEVLLSQAFGTVASRTRIYLTSRTTAREVILQGHCAGVSFDGSLTGFEDLDRKVHVYRTMELFDKMSGSQEVKPIWTGDFYFARQIRFSADNSRLYIYGDTMQQSGRVEVIDLSKGRQLWEKDWVNPPSNIAVSEDLRFLVFSSGLSVEAYNPR